MRAILLGLAATLMAGGAHAGPASDALGQCVVESTTGRDRVAFVRWMFGAIALHPQVASMSKVTPADNLNLAKETGALIDRLILKDCRDEALQTVRDEGSDGLMASFRTFGEVAMQELMNNAAVNKQFEAISEHVDPAVWAEIVAAGQKPKK
jgi:hypothetical protein